MKHAPTPVDNSELIVFRENATVTSSLEQSTWVKAVLVHLNADQTLEATGSFPVLINPFVPGDFAEKRVLKVLVVFWPLSCYKEL